MAMDIIKKIEVFGDSILKGIQVSPGNKRYQVDNHIDVDLISKTHSVSIENFSRFGCTIAKGRSLLLHRLESGDSCDMAVMNYGGNDCDFNWRAIAEDPSLQHQPHTPLNVFVETYSEIIRVLRQRGILPVLATLPPLEPQRFFNWFCAGPGQDNVLKWLGSVNAIYRFHENYSRTVEKIARDENVPVVDLRGAFLSNRRIEHLICEDGAHPNTEGQKIITSAFLCFAERLSQSRHALPVIA